MTTEQLIMSLLGLFVSTVGVFIGGASLIRNEIRDSRRDISSLINKNADALQAHVVADATIHADHAARIDTIEAKFDRLSA